MSQFTLTPICLDVTVIQHAEHGDFCYSEYGSKEGAWSEEKTSWWVTDHPVGVEAAKEEFMGTLREYSKEEVLAAAQEGQTWPLIHGFVVATEESDE